MSVDLTKQMLKFYHKSMLFCEIIHCMVYYRLYLSKQILERDLNKQMLIRLQNQLIDFFPRLIFAKTKFLDINLTRNWVTNWFLSTKQEIVQNKWLHKQSRKYNQKQSFKGCAKLMVDLFENIKQSISKNLQNKEQLHKANG